MEVSLESITSFDGLVVAVNVYRAGEGGRRPVIVYLHGGPAGASSIGWSTRARFFVSRGYAWIEPNIRGSGGFGRSFQAADDGRKRPDSFKEIDAVRIWLAAQPWADTERLVVFGDSFGGFLVLHQLVENPSVWRQVWTRSGSPTSPPSWPRPMGWCWRTTSRSWETRWSSASSWRACRPCPAPTESALPFSSMLGEDEGHGISLRDNEIEFYVRVARFLAHALGWPS